MNYPKNVLFEDPIAHKGFDIHIAAYETEQGSWSGSFRVFLNDEPKWQSSVVNQFDDRESARQAVLDLAKAWVDGNKT